jgi:kynurenine/2-aminoadipate aminotransferase
LHNKNVGKQRKKHSGLAAGLNVEPGFLSLDIDGRVIRVDTFSKCLAPGLRLGWLTASRAVLAPLTAALTATTYGPSGLSIMAAHTLTSSWGFDGFHTHLQRVQARYRTSARVLDAALREHCAGLVEWKVPEGGMFLWLRVLDRDDLAANVLDALVEYKVCSDVLSIIASHQARAVDILQG